MIQHSHQTAPTQFVDANGLRFAYRRFGKAAGVPLVFNMHYLGTMDYWDPTVTDALTLGNGGDSPTPGNHTAETGLAGWGARIRTWKWRNQKAAKVL
jgi:hypothetical protein